MTNLEDANSPIPTSPSPLRTWDFMETVFVSLVVYGVYILTSWLALAIMFAVDDGASTLSPTQLQARWHGAVIVASPFAIGVLWIAIRIARREFAEYLALNWASPGELMRAGAIMTILVSAELVIWSLAGAKGQATSPLTVNGAGGLLTLLIGGCIAGPVVEEFTIRGFIFRGWSQSFLGPIGTIVLTSAVWAMIHTEYDWVERFPIFVAGLALGHFRWRSNSTWLTVMIHSAFNIFSFFTMGPYI
jgi:CAAX protease family protein